VARSAQLLSFDFEPVEVSDFDRSRKQPLPSIPDTGWRTPTEFPRLDAAKIIAIDTETYDPELLTHGPGWARGKGHMVGMSVAVDERNRWYFPMRHSVCPEQNMDPQAVLRWAQDTLGNRNQIKTGANLGYDLGWLRQEGVHVKGPLFDVQFAETLLDEEAKVNLDALALKYLNQGKETSVMYDWIRQAYGHEKGFTEKSIRKWIHCTPPSLVGHYAEADADLPLRLAPILQRKLVEEGLYHIFDMENTLIYVLQEMRFAGVTVNVGKAEELRRTLLGQEQLLQDEIDALVGFEVNPSSTKSLTQAFSHLGIKIGKNGQDKESFEKEVLAKIDHPFCDKVLEFRKVNKLRSTFVESYILDSHVNGKVYGQFHNLKGDDEGARSGRFSSSMPNLQNLPSRDKILAPLTRGIFEPDAGHAQWDKYDYSQIEYRFLIHYACGTGAQEARDHFNANPDTDYHERALDLVGPEAGWDLSTKALRDYWRKPIKNVNFGLIYGMGQAKLARQIKMDQKQARALFDAYHRGVPFAKATMEATSLEAAQLGYITTFLGRRSRFTQWEPNTREGGFAYPFEEAVRRYGANIRRSKLHKALNRRLQGSAADMIKLALVRLWEEGVFNYTGIPRLTVHDELDFSNPGGVEEAYQYVQHVMETVMPLSIPVKAERESGPDWGHTFKTAT
jgi:DNA polymerase I-like protein with 3'-5' exonuclease and polymerase domains